MKILLISCLLLATLDISAGLRSYGRKVKKRSAISYGRNTTNPTVLHLIRSIASKSSKTNCHSHPECHTTYVDHCEPVFKKQCRGGGKKKGKKFKRDVAKELVHSEEEDVDEDEDEDLEVIRKMSTAELLDIMAESEDGENSSNRSKEKRDIAAKIHKLFKKGKKEECETVHHGEHCEKVPVENCHDVEKCTKEIHRECKKIPHEKCWQEPHEKCWQVPHETCVDVPHEKCWEEPRESCWDEPKQVCTQVPWEKCSK